MDKVKTIFLGTGWESVATLKALNESNEFEVVAVITTPDKPVGRKQILTPSEVKVYAVEHGIPVEHTEKKEERYLEVAREYQPDIVVCKAFGEIVPKSFLDFPRYSCINIHFSILPKYRGAVPIQKAILDGEKETGISIMLMSEGLDEGDILDIYTEEIRRDDTNVSLRERLVKKSAEILIPLLLKWIKGEVVPIKQDSSLATYCWQKDISKESAEIKWNRDEPEFIEKMVRALLPWPVAWTKLPESKINNISNKVVKIFKAEVCNINSNKEPGELWSDGTDVYISTKEKGICIKLIEFQIEGKNRTNAKDFLNGIGAIIIKN